MNRRKAVRFGVNGREFNVRFGSKADMCNANSHVRSYPESGHCREVCNARERLLKRQAERHRGEAHDEYCKEYNFH